MRAREGVAGYLSEYSRLSGAGPSLLEVTSRDAMLEVLSRAFSTPVQSADVKFLRYRKVGKGVELEDMAGRLGGILTSVEPRDADPKALLAYLKKHGAKTFKAESLDEAKQPWTGKFWDVAHYAKELPRFEFIMHYVARMTRKKKDRDVVEDMQLKWGRGGWYYTVGGMPASNPTKDAGRVYDMIRRTPLNYLVRKAEDLRTDAHMAG